MSSPPFSDQWFAPFRSSPFSLRFELGGETFGNDAPVPRFLQAFGRARQVAHDLFSESQPLFGIVASPPDTARDIYSPAPDGFAALAEAGFVHQPISEWTAPMWAHHDEEGSAPFLWRSFDLSGDVIGRDVLIWCAVSYEMAIAPKAAVLSFLADFGRGIVMHVYDDRGMDVTALDRQRLLPIYREREEWLLAYDRSRMDKAFGDAP